MGTDWRTRTVVVTGSSGSGKSTVCNLFEDRGASVVRADELAREVLDPGSKIFQEVVAAFGPEILTSDGTLNRPKLRDLVFSDPVKRRTLEQLTHPEIQRIAGERISDALALGHPFVLYDCPLFFEAGLDQLPFRAVVVVTAPENILVARIAERDHISEKQARQRLAAQLDASQKIAKADYIVENSGSKAELNKKVAQLYEQLKTVA